jgi:streptogramin lyase
VKVRPAVSGVLLATFLTACTGNAPADEPAAHPSSVGGSAVAGSIVATVPVADRAVAMAYDGRYLWVGGASGQVTQVDTTISQAIRTIRLPGRPIDVAVTPEGVWVADNAGNTVSRLDPGSGEVAATVRVGANPLGFAQVERDLWVFSQSDQRASVLDPRAARVTRTIPLPGLSAGYPEVADGAIWVPDLAGTTRSVWRVDPDGTVTDRVATGNQPAQIAFGFGSGWVSDEEGVSRFDPATRKEQARVTGLGRQLDGVAVTTDAVWVVSIADNRLTRIDPSTNRATSTLQVCTGPRHLAVVDDDIWVACFNAGMLVRVHPS